MRSDVTRSRFPRKRNIDSRLKNVPTGADSDAPRALELSVAMGEHRDGLVRWLPAGRPTPDSWLDTNLERRSLGFPRLVANLRYRSDLATRRTCATHSPLPRRSSNHNGLSSVCWISTS